MATKTKLVSLIAMALVALAVMIFGVFAATSQTITMQGVVNINVDDQTLYLRDVRMQTDMAESPKSVPGFRKGYINGDFQLDLSSHGLAASTTGTFVLYFDIVNLIISGQTSEYIVEADWVGGAVSGALFSIDYDSRMIDEGTVTPANLTDSTPLSGSVALEVNVTSGTSFDLSKIAITVREPQQITTDLTFTTDDVTMTAEVKGNNSSATSIVIPRSISKHSDGTFWEGNDYAVTKIGDSAFLNYSNLGSVTIPEGVTEIMDSAFQNCSIESIAIPNSVTSIGDYAFSGISNLLSVAIGSGMQSIGDCAFQSCTSLISLTIDSGAIGQFAFQECTSLESVTIGSAVQSIGDYAFNSCFNLELINIPDSVISIGDYAFSDSSSLSSVIIGSGVQSIGVDAFQNCSDLTSVTIKAITPPTLGEFAIPSNVTNIYVPAVSVEAYNAAPGWSEYANKISAIA